jgi:proteasome lid subunit RPN8/RPN11
VSIARASLPNEACGLLAGRLESDGLVVVSAVIPVENSLRSPTAFALDGDGMIRAEEAIDATTNNLIGVMHSHPSSEAIPSARDLEDAANYDPRAHLIHMIVSMQGFSPTVRAYRYDGGEAGRSEFHVVSDERP